MPQLSNGDVIVTIVFQCIDQILGEKFDPLLYNQCSITSFGVFGLGDRNNAHLWRATYFIMIGTTFKIWYLVGQNDEADM